MSMDAAERLKRLEKAITSLGAASIELDLIGMHEERGAVDDVLAALLTKALTLAGFQPTTEQEHG